MKSFFEGKYITDNHVIGQGSFSTVYVGREIESGTPVAIKEINMSVFDEVHLSRELNNMQQAQHHNIVRIYHAFLENGNAYLILELCQGGTLSNRLKTVQRFDDIQAASIIAPILCAVEYLHNRNIIHRDIKAGNIFFYDDTPNSRVLLGDFGFSKQVNEHDNATSYAGTPEYMAPEVIKAIYDGAAPYDRKCDIWSIGVLAFQLICGHVPFTAKLPLNLIKHMNERKYDFHCLGGEEARNFVDLCLNPDPSQRPEASDLLQHPFIKAVTQ
jgi:calcium/calmodulin-dependent protein kinase I